jgi:hypothetical protein
MNAESAEWVKGTEGKFTLINGVSIVQASMHRNDTHKTETKKGFF